VSCTAAASSCSGTKHCAKNHVPVGCRARDRSLSCYSCNMFPSGVSRIVGVQPYIPANYRAVGQHQSTLPSGPYLSKPRLCRSVSCRQFLENNLTTRHMKLERCCSTPRRVPHHAASELRHRGRLSKVIERDGPLSNNPHNTVTFIGAIEACRCAVELDAMVQVISRYLTSKREMITRSGVMTSRADSSPI
jgi:hypothetical protein